MTNSKNYITPSGFKALQDEFSELFHNERPKLVETVAWAAGNGDRSENGDYIYGKKRLRQIDSRLRFLRDRIEAAHIIDPKEVDSKTIQFSATLTIETEEGDVHKYQIVGEDELNPHENKISWKSPMAKALLGKKVGDEVLIKRPKGDLWVEVLNLEYI